MPFLAQHRLRKSLRLIHRLLESTFISGLVVAKYLRKKLYSNVHGRKIVIINLQALGDTVISFPVIREFVQRTQADVILVVAEKYAAVARERLEGIAEVFGYDGDILKMSKTIRHVEGGVKRIYDISTNKNLMAFYMSQILCVELFGSGYCKQKKRLYDFCTSISSDLLHISDIYRDALGLPRSFVFADDIPQGTFYDFFKDKKVVIHPGASTRMRMWPIENYVAFASWLAEFSKVSFIDCLELSVLERRAITEKFDMVSAGNNVVELMGIISSNDIFVGNYSGPLHLASELSKDIIAITGPSFCLFYPILNNNIRIVLKKELPCIGCEVPVDCKRKIACLNSFSMKEARCQLLDMFRGVCG